MKKLWPNRNELKPNSSRIRTEPELQDWPNRTELEPTMLCSISISKMQIQTLDEENEGAESDGAA